MSKIFLHVTIDVRPGKYQEFVALLKNHLEIITTELGCEYIEIFQNPEQADVVHVHETWTDRAAWDAHMANENSASWEKVAAEYVFGETIAILNRL
jgi:(4S)-4-hydroxy-5-phosphonooxypentane-2,3-dione isomerase